MDRLTSDEVADRLVKDKAKFIKHHNVWLAEKENWKQMQASYLKDKHTIVIGRDFSQNIACEAQLETQSMYMNRKSLMLHVSIIWYLEHKYYLYTGGNMAVHRPEIVLLALKRAVDFIESEHDVKLKLVVTNSDNCKEQFKSGKVWSLHLSFAYEYDVKLLLCFGTPQHGKGEVDSAAGSGFKLIVKRDIWSGVIKGLSNIQQCFESVQRKDSTSKVTKVYQEVTQQELDALIATQKTIDDDSKPYALAGSESCFMIEINATGINVDGKIASTWPLRVKKQLSGGNDDWITHGLVGNKRVQVKVLASTMAVFVKFKTDFLCQFWNFLKPFQLL